MALHAKMPNLQLYPWNLYLFKNVEDTVVFLTQKVFNSEIFSLLWYRCTSDISIFAWRVRFCIREIYPVPCLSVVNVISYVPRQGRISSGSGLTFSGILSFLKQSGAISRLWSSLQDFSSNQNRHRSKLSTARNRKL